MSKNASFVAGGERGYTATYPARDIHWAMSADDLASLPPTAPGGGDFGVALDSRTDTIDESNIGGPSRLRLKVRPAPPQYPYADTFFSFEVCMCPAYVCMCADAKFV